MTMTIDRKVIHKWKGSKAYTCSLNVFVNVSNNKGKFLTMQYNVMKIFPFKHMWVFKHECEISFQLRLGHQGDGGMDLTHM
jgi:hypothetical protein